MNTYSEEWRAECEARAVLAMPGRERRAAFITLVEARRGKPAADKLKSDVWALWQKSQSQPA